LSQRRVAQLISIERMTLRYEHHRDPQEALRIRLRELAGSRVRYGYRRLTVLLKREGWEVNAKRIYRLYAEEGLIVRTKKRKGRAQRQRLAQGSALRPDQKWSMDFVAQRLSDGRWIRVLTVVDQYTRECVTLLADNTLSGEKVATALDKALLQRGVPESITVDNGTEFTSKALDHWPWETRSVFQGGSIAVFSTAAGGCKLRRCTVVQSRVGALVVVVAPPEMQLPPGVGQVEEHLHVQALVAELAVEALDVAVLHWPAWADEVQMHSVPVRPVIERLTRELRSVVHGDRLRHATLQQRLVQRRCDLLPAQRVVGQQCHALPCVLVDHR